jgi:hypothetical protein
MRIFVGILLTLLLSTTAPAAVQAASSPDVYQDTSTQYMTGDTPVAAAAGQTVCAGASLPAGTMVVDFFRADNIACVVGFPYSPWNVWIIDNLNATNSQGFPVYPVGTIVNVCTDYNRVVPAGWVVDHYFQSSGLCGHPQFVTYFNVAALRRVTAPLPPTPANEGFFDSASCSALAGWAWSSSQPNTPVNVDIIADGTVVGQIVANLFRSDLQAAGKGNGSHGFNVPVPKVLLDNVTHSLTLRVTGTSFVLTGSPRSIHCANPIDDQQFFVRQHYLDFLSREPDAGGLSFWTNNITQCGSDAACVDRMRVETSKAFFLSIEFQQTGYYVHRFYKASYGRVPTILEFFPDKQRVSNGVVVGATGWDTQLEANKQAFASSWVQRDAFRNMYDSLSNASYVDALFANAGVVPDSVFRNDLINGLNAATYTRGTALRKIVEYQPFAQQEFNPAFVLMQYFGYLRRNPSDPPDNNLNGYNFWLNDLNQTNDQSHMVRAFILSTEYRGRFGKP